MFDRYSGSFSSSSSSPSRVLTVVLTLLLAGLASPPAQAQTAATNDSATAPAAELAAALRVEVVQREREILAELIELLAIPNVADDRPNIERNARHLRGLLEQRGLTTQLLDDTPGSPAVYGELEVPGARRTVMLYAHFDGQPVDPERWATPPWNPTLLTADGRPLTAAELDGPLDGEWRLHARSASDDKSPIVAMLAALDALRATGRQPSVSIKLFLEGEEEVGSPHLGTLLSRHRDLLASDVMLFCDGPVHQSRRPQVVFGVRGVLGLEATVYGPNRGLHSGHYGNWAPNPAMLLVDLLGSMRDADGHLKITGLSQAVRPLSDAELAALAALPDVDPELRETFGLARSEAANAPLGRRIGLPALNVRGLRSGAVGDEAKNAIPTTATASIDFRLVPDLTPETIQRAVEDHLDRSGWHRVDGEPTDAERRRHPRLVSLEWGKGYPPARTAMELTVSQAVLEILDEAAGEPVLRVPTLGGSLPLYLFEEHLEVPFLVVPMVNHDNNQHAPNENLRLQNLWDGVVTYGVLLAELGKRW